MDNPDEEDFFANSDGYPRLRKDSLPCPTQAGTEPIWKDF